MKTNAASVRFDTTALGKPFVRPSARATAAPAFSMSHSECIALVAVSADHPIGVDVERVRPLPDIDHLLERFFTSHEQASILAMNPDDKLAAFYRCWSRKEAVLKASGLGLSADLGKLSVDWDESPRPRVRTVNAGLSPTDQWSLVHLELLPGFTGAVAAAVPIRATRLLRWRPHDNGNTV